ncbi:MAG: helix-turn-helix domain-containing protein [Nitrososphaerales archaeon]
MMNLSDAEDTMVRELKVSREEAKIYMLLLTRGEMSKTEIAQQTGLYVDSIEEVVSGLIHKGTCIELNDKYEALNPRFAIINMYKMMCYSSKLEVKRNKTVDQLATLLEKPFEDARTK